MQTLGASAKFSVSGVRPERNRRAEIAINARSGLRVWYWRNSGAEASPIEISRINICNRGLSRTEFHPTLQLLEKLSKFSSLPPVVAARGFYECILLSLLMNKKD